jgi:protein involved in polysaccharide export with SLBB domain
LPASYSAAYQATFHPRLTLSTEYTDNLERSNEDGQEKIYRVNYKDIIKGKDFSQNIKLQPDDTIIVP